MYVRLGQVPSIVQPANPNPQNDAVLYPTQPQSNVRRLVDRWPIQFPQYQANFPQSTTAIAPVTSGLTVVGYDASGNPIYGTAGSQAASVTATVSATPGSLTSWLQTGNNGIYAAIGVAVLLLLLTRRR